MITISIRPIIIRVLLFLMLAAGVGALGWLIAQTAVGDSIMTFVQRNPRLSVEAQMQGADLAAKYSPRDPLIRMRRGGVYFAAANEDQSEEQMKVALSELRRAAELSPEDFRTWLALGRAHDRTGATAEARSALERALKLAPNHFETRWAFGNYLLRANDRDASFEQMRAALANRPSALPLVFDYAWAVYQGDGKAVAKALDPPISVKSQMVAMLILRNKVDDGLAIWREMTAPTLKDVRRVTESLINIGRYGAAYGIWNAADLPDRPAPDRGSLLANGDFKTRFSPGSPVPFFAWRVSPGGGLRVTLDRKEPKEGAQSLLASFEVEDNVAFTIASQTVPVKPNQKYCLSFFARTENLQSLSSPFVEIFDSADLKRAHIATAPMKLDTHAWTEYVVSLRTAPVTEALTVRVQRQPCPTKPCPIEGRVWFDEFKLSECADTRKPEKRDRERREIGVTREIPIR